VSRTERTIAAPPEDVWAVLAQPDNYAHWVVGSRDVRAADPGFPAAGTRFHHTLALGPFSLDDHSEVKRSEPPTYLELEVKARPFGRGYVKLELRPIGGATHVVMLEGPLSPGARIAHNPVADLLLHGRNVEALKRLAALAEGREPTPQTTRSSGG
jgi:uncharacterized protein YndB with AHSA1/START domain